MMGIFLGFSEFPSGERPVRVFASGGQDVNHLEERYGGRVPDILDNAYVILDYPGGRRAMLELCMFAEGGRNQEEVTAVGDRGKIEAHIPSNEIAVGGRGEPWFSPRVEKVTDPRIAYQGHHYGASYLEHLDFRDAILGAGKLRVSVEDGLWAVAMGAAAQLSIAETRPVAMTEILPQEKKGDRSARVGCPTWGCPRQDIAKSLPPPRALFMSLLLGGWPECPTKGPTPRDDIRGAPRHRGHLFCARTVNTRRKAVPPERRIWNGKNVAHGGHRPCQDCCI